MSPWAVRAKKKQKKMHIAMLLVIPIISWSLNSGNPGRTSLNICHQNLQQIKGTGGDEVRICWRPPVA
jgi:Flp pilus assembly protein TadB